MGKVEKELVKTYYHARNAHVDQHRMHKFKEYETLYMVKNDMDFDLSRISYGYQYVDGLDLINKYPNLLNKPNIIGTLSGEELARVFSPEYAHTYDEVRNHFTPEAMNALSHQQVVDIIKTKPELWTIFPPERLKKLNSKGIKIVLRHAPELYKNLNLKTLEDHEIIDSVMYANEYKHKILQALHREGVLEKLTPQNIAYMLIQVPRWIKYFTPEQLEEFEGKHIAMLLPTRPELYSYFDLNKLTDRDIAEVLSVTKKDWFNPRRNKDHLGLVQKMGKLVIDRGIK